ncbi:TIGR04283 family arsenosugar biosynthesis glycosyltransferase [Marinobacter zhanjiangensis]|uniref:Glycosyl transferase family 2 n=1 Tax=Marinobacter zhanjiangensis TaxID=578215 RepID=A0ABQ3B1K7_9GAMM|nr:TIGR04283 family arsenosugar biosynthesis glycosyltransferase [Marinobacter zhanjiangensis]GGY71195.1 glycosyl transferase family 2 [Marinobacter zhanjiangensis]
MPRSTAVSIIVPVLNESASIVPALERLSALRDAGAEVIVVDGGSADDTVALATPLCDRVVDSDRGRALQMNRGAAEATGEVLLFLHADTVLPEGADQALEAFRPSNHAWGRFDVRLSGTRPLFRLIAFMMNLRSRLTGIATGDQGIFVRRSLFEDLGGYRELPLMEDVELCRRLRRVSRPFCIGTPVITDSRRWEQLGAWHTIVLMWRLRWRYWRGGDPAELARAYRADVRHPGSPTKKKGASDR